MVPAEANWESVMDAPAYKKPASSLVAAGLLVTVVFSAATIALHLSYPGHGGFMLLAALGLGIAALLAVVLARLLLEQWRAEGFPNAIGWLGVALSAPVAFAGWWVSPGAAQSCETHSQKRLMCRQGAALTFAFWCIVLGLPFTAEPLVFWAAVAAAVIIGIKYISLGNEFLFVED